ncbi:MAG: Glu/Leu/Phe/Val dehydrogenase dimerization domain-containing protein [Phycisphaerae bacterium]|nr:Glu/Leu/Phe/Val dehydrogenase dimerization domain-containing protein [Phycisphaerae bacterium]
MNVLEQMMSYGHERVTFHQDPATGLRAIIAIHSTTLGNALGGTRRWCYASEDDAMFDVLRLSEGMTYKAAASDLQMGGAKSIILMPRPDHQPTEAEARAMGRFVDTLAGKYIAAEDVGVSPQFCDWMALETKHVMGGNTVSHGGDPSPYTALGCFNSMKSCLAFLGKKVDFSNLTVGIQGVGATGYRLAKLLRQEGAAVLVTDVHVPTMKRAVEELGCVALGNDRNLFAEKLDIVAPCALGGTLDTKTIDSLKCTIVCGTANNQLKVPDIDGAALKQKGILYAPDFVANAGGLIRLAGLYLGLSEALIDQKIDQIEHTTTAIFTESNSQPSTSAAAVAYAKRKIAAGAKPRQPVSASR